SIKLLSPWKKGENSYRYYSKAQFEIISMIIFMRSIGTPIKRLTEILNDEGAGGVQSELKRCQEEINERIAELELLRRNVKVFDDNIQGTCYGADIKIVKLPEMYMMSKPFGEEDELDIDEIINVTSGATGWANTAGLISTITPENLLAGRFHDYEKYGYISEITFAASNNYTEVIESGKYVVGNMKIKTVEHFEADETYSRMIKFIEKHDLKITGPAIERNILDLYCGNRFSPTMFFKVYIPVE
ncbi:MAG: hypothetical protein J6U15_02300, partial [Lachnospiraceae bacterium]|nr:hypothetical protein [Lachnospiraceae bacterium]